MSSHPAKFSGGNREQLRELKLRLRPKYLGKFGIHAIGTRVADDAICVYLNPGAKDQDEGLKHLQQEVAPHKLVVVEEESPRIS